MQCYACRTAIRGCRLQVFFLVLAAIGTSLGRAQMVAPEIDKPGEPFSYFSKPTDVIGVMNAPSATEISP